MRARAGIPGPTNPVGPQIDDAAVGRTLASHAKAIAELQEGPAVIQAVELVDATPTLVAHKLGRPPKFIRPSAPWSPTGAALTAGSIRELRTSTADRNYFITLQADGFGATVRVDVMVL